jgi:hypothetical protein
MECRASPGAVQDWAGISLIPASCFVSEWNGAAQAAGFPRQAFLTLGKG